MDFSHSPAGLEKNRRYRPEDEESWLAQTPLNHAVYMQEQGYDTCGRTAWQGKIIRSTLFVLNNSHFMFNN
ncbi:hypothetical protein FEK43_22365 [Escherichia sp. E2562]|nr:hypothetical protein FEK43_22365 [Escherichia sp. E2562]